MTKLIAKSSAILLLGAVLASCGEAPVASVQPFVSGSVSRVARLDAPTPLDSVADALARGLRDSSARMHLLSAMRASPYVTGRVNARNYLSSQAGGTLARAAEHAMGWQDGKILALLGTHSDLQLEIGFAAHRLRWEGGPLFVANAATQEQGAVPIFRGDGRSFVPEHPRDVRNSPTALLLITPPEAAELRTTVRNHGPVQVASERATVSDRVQYISAEGDTTILSLRKIASGQDENFVLAEASASGSDVTRLDYLSVNWWGDNSLSDNEVELRATFLRPNGTADGTFVYLNTEIAADEDYFLAVPFIERRIPDSTTARLRVEVWEKDCNCFGNDHDFMGERFFLFTDRAQTRSVIKGGDITQIELDWIPKAPPVATHLVLTASSTEIPVNSTVSVWAQVVDQYGWTMNSVSASWSNSAPQVLDFSGHQLSGSGIGVGLGWSTVGATYGGALAQVAVLVSETGGGGCPPNDPNCQPFRAPMIGGRLSAAKPAPTVVRVPIPQR